MTKLIMARRRFLFAAPALVASTSLMKVHSIDHLLLQDFSDAIATFDLFSKGWKLRYWGFRDSSDGLSKESFVSISKAEYLRITKRLSV